MGCEQHGNTCSLALFLGPGFPLGFTSPFGEALFTLFFLASSAAGVAGAPAAVLGPAGVLGSDGFSATLATGVAFDGGGDPFDDGVSFLTGAGFTMARSLAEATLRVTIALRVPFGVLADEAGVGFPDLRRFAEDDEALGGMMTVARA